MPLLNRKNTRNQNDRFRKSVGKNYFLNLLYALTAIILISLAGYFGYKAYNYFFYKKKIFILRKIIIIGKGITAAEKNKVIKQSGLIKKENLINVSLKRVSRLIASDRWIKDVTVYKKYPDRIIIVLKKRKTFAMIVYNEDLYYISRGGYVTGKTYYGAGYDYPVITGLNKVSAGDYFKKLKKVLYFLNIAKNYMTSNLISEVSMEKDGGISVYTDKGLYIKFGIGRYKNKLVTLKKLFYEINALHLKYKPYINLEYKNEAVIKVNAGSRILPANYKNVVISNSIFK